MKFSIKDFFSKFEQGHITHLMKKSLIENFIFCVMFCYKLRKQS